MSGTAFRVPEKYRKDIYAILTVETTDRGAFQTQ